MHSTKQTRNLSDLTAAASINLKTAKALGLTVLSRSLRAPTR